MSESRALYGPLVDRVVDFPEPIAAMLLLIEKRHPPGVVRLLSEYVASLASAHSTSCLAGLLTSSVVVRVTAFELFEYCMTQGLTDAERHGMLVWVQPHLQKR